MDDIAWLRILHEELWVKKPSPRAAPTLTKEEFERVLNCIEKYKLVAEMVSTHMFGGYGMQLYEHELYPGTGPQLLVLISEDNLPVPTRYDRILGTAQEPPKRKPGSGRDDAWEIFSRYTHSEQNRKWLKEYKLHRSEERVHYDY